jgi:hypothetical protein
MVVGILGGKSMRGVRSLMAVVLAILAVCLISVPAFSGEHPWDSDGNQSGSSGESNLPYDSTKGSAVILSSSVGPDEGGQTVRSSSTYSMMSLVFHVSYYVAERVFTSQYGTGARVSTAVRKSGR